MIKLVPPNLVAFYERVAKMKPGDTLKLEKGETLEDLPKVINIPELKPFTITSTIKLSATDARAAILKASQLLADLANGTPYEFETLNVKVE